jgi:hypothetical protein
VGATTHPLMFVPLVFAATLVAAESRCNGLVAAQLQDQVRAFDTHRPAEADLDTRMSALQDVLDQSSREQDILAHTCPAGDLVPIASQLLAVQGWTYSLQADIVHQEFASSCATSADAVTAGFVAAGWLRAARSTPTGGTANPLSTRVDMMLQKQAGGLKMTLPAAADTSDYWVKTVQDLGRSAAAACPTPQA